MREFLFIINKFSLQDLMLFNFIQSKDLSNKDSVAVIDFLTPPPKFKPIVSYLI